MSSKPTQHEKVLSMLKAVRAGTHNVPEEYMLRSQSGAGISSRYFKQVMFISEVNARVHELQRKGYQIRSSTHHKDRHGFIYYRLEADAKVEVQSATEPEKKYEVYRIRGTEYRCTCEGFRYRKTCHHIDDVQKKLILQ